MKIPTEQRMGYQTDGERPGKWLAMFLLCGILLAVAALPAAVRTTAVQAQGLTAEETAEDSRTGSGASSGRRQLKITVVEDIPAAEIEDDAVPLAGVPGTAERSGLRHLLWMGAFLAAAAVYVIYFSRYDRRLFLMRREAAGAEQACRLRQREKSAVRGNRTGESTEGGYEQ